MAFTDDFNRSDEDLETSGNWTRVDGGAGAARVHGNEVDIVYGFGANEAAYTCPDQSSADHYTQAVHTATGTNNWLCVRLTDHNNYFGARLNGTTLQIYLRVSGSFGLLGSWAGAAAGNTIKIEINGTAIKGYVNGTERVSATDSSHAGVTGQGFSTYTVVGSYIDDFEAGPFAAAAVDSLVYPRHRNQPATLLRI